jgi:CBS-domain-containing membrane protein
MPHCDERATVVVDDPRIAGTDWRHHQEQHGSALALGHDLNEVRVSDIWAKAPPRVGSAASVGDATTAMLCHGARYLPLVDRGRLVGIVYLPDLRRHLPRTRFRP